MYRFFVKPEQIDMEEKKVHITGSDVNHIKMCFGCVREKPS